MVVRIEPGPGQEFVWDYPRPPRVEVVPERLRVVVGGTRSRTRPVALRVLETAGAPVYYFPSDDVRMDLFVASPRSTFCEWKGGASYHTLAVDGREIDERRLVLRRPESGLRGHSRPPRVLRREGRRGVGRR